jgi:hypothetical protein
MGISIKKNGIVSSNTLSNYIYNVLDPNYYIEPDNSVWIRIAHHNNPGTTNLFSSSNSFSTQVYLDSNRWFNCSLLNKVGINKWELMIKQKGASTDTEQKYRLIQSYNPMTASFDQTKTANVTINTSSGYTTPSSSYGGFYYNNGSNTWLVANNNVNGNWFCAIGSWATWNNGIPGYNGVAIITGYLDFYLRVDNDPKKSAMFFKDSIVSTEFIEI